MRTPVHSEIDDAIRDYYGNVTSAEMAALTSETFKSAAFRNEMLDGLALLATKPSPAASLATVIAIMLSVGMRLQQKRYEVAELERMYAMEPSV